MTSVYLKIGDELKELTERPYEAESILQQLIAEHPGLIAGSAEASDSTGKLVLVEREAGVEDALDGNARWSLDHLLLDPTGVPTLVEVKRSSDTRIRREVVGQMLDYAANISSFWGVERIRETFEQAYADPETTLAESLGVHDAEMFWERVASNVQSAKLRLVFVADRIPSELRRIVEFLNEQMTRSDVLAIEVKQFGSDDSEETMLVPTVIGLTEAAREVKSASGAKRRQWTEAEFIEGWEGVDDKALGQRVLGLYRRALELNPSVSWGRAAWPSVSLWFGSGTGTPVSVGIYADSIAINFDFAIDAGRSLEETQRMADLARNLVGVVPYLQGLEDQKLRAHRGMKWGDVLATESQVDGFIEFFRTASRPGQGN